MKSFPLVAALLAGFMWTTAAPAQDLEPEPVKPPAQKAKHPAFVEVVDTPGLPRVLLMGDSISMGYTLAVRERLKDTANVHRPPQNCGDTARGLDRLAVWLGDGRWDVIHFNFGLHDLKYLDPQGQYVSPEKGRQVAPPEVYRQRLRKITIRLQATGARLIFATTTPVPPGTLGRVPGDEKTYNAVAFALMREMNVPVDDLWAFVAAQQEILPPRPESEKPTPPRRAELRPGEMQLPFNVHFTPEGYELMGEQVAASIRTALSAAD